MPLSPEAISKSPRNKVGRPRGSVAGHTIQSSQARQFLIEKIWENMTPIVNAQTDLAKGIFVERANGRVYQKEPDARVGEYLLNQISGRPTESIQLANKDSQPFVIKIDS